MKHARVQIIRSYDSIAQITISQGKAPTTSVADVSGNKSCIVLQNLKTLTNEIYLRHIYTFNGNSIKLHHLHDTSIDSRYLKFAYLE